MDSTGSLVRCPSGTSLALNLPSCLTAYTKWTLIFWKSSGVTTFPLWNCALPVSLKTLYSSELTQGPLHLANVCCYFPCQVLWHHCNPLGLGNHVDIKLML